MEVDPVKETSDFDAVFPGENYFFYWKTSSSLWRVKLEENAKYDHVIIPIFWGFHYRREEKSYDFAQFRPETNLKKLCEIITEQGKQAIFLIGLTGFPFLPSGGLPIHLAKNMALWPNGLAQSFLDQEGNVHKLFSFFGPEIYQEFQKFCWTLANYIMVENIQVEVVGAFCGRLHESRFYPFLIDNSKCFVSGLSKYIRVKAQEDDEFKAVAVNQISDDIKSEYVSVIQDLYLSTCKKYFKEFWKGHQNISFIGGHCSSMYERLSQRERSRTNYVQEYMEVLKSDAIPCSILLDSATKNGPLKKVFLDLSSRSNFLCKLQGHYEGIEENFFTPLHFFEIHDLRNFWENSHLENEYSWDSMGLIEYARNNNRWPYLFKTKLERFDNDQDLSYKAFFFRGMDLNHNNLSYVFKVFLNNGKVLIDKASLSKEQGKRIDLFFLENSIEEHQVNIGITVRIGNLGEGKLILFDGPQLASWTKSKRKGFWEKMGDFLGFPHITVNEEAGVQFYWQKRAPFHNEFDYEEIRRVGFYNPTSYKKKVHILSHTNFNLTKVLDEIHVVVESKPLGVDIFMNPGGSVTLDFGYFE